MRDDYGNIWSYRAKWAYLLGVVAALLAPVFYIITISFNEHGFGARIYEFTFDWYTVVLGDTMLVASLEWTAYLALAAVATAVPMGLLAAKAYKRARRKVVFVTVMLSPLFVPADIMASSMLVFFKHLGNFFEALSDATGVTLFYGWFELGFLTALIGQIVYTLPYTFVVILITMSRYREQQTEAARACGATAWQAFWHVEFPQIRAGVFSAGAFVVILSFNEASRTALLKGGFDTFSNVLVSQMLNIGMSGESYAMAGIMSIGAMTVIGSILIYTLVRSERLEREARAKAEPVMST
ncbi:MAG: ABC transporter permease subunit [Rhodospirillales bacterium]|jgi:spermidine/putrescine transport system permease protein|nr:ABC transporter permease subunit [Rhodospirillales bacterium]